MNNNKQAPKWGNYLYLIVPVILILSMAYLFGGSNDKDKTKYYEVVNSFRTGQVTEFSLNLSTGALDYVVEGKEKEKYTVPNVEIFLNDVHNYINEYNLENPDNQVKYDYIKGSSGTWWASMAPMAILSLLMVGAMFYIYRKMGQNITNEANRTLTFGKARIKMGKDIKKPTTFKDVAGADEEKAELEEIVEFLDRKSVV